MKKYFVKLNGFLLLIVTLIGLSACGGGNSGNPSPAVSPESSPVSDGHDNNSTASEPSEPIVIRVGAVPTPHGDILEQVKDVLAEQGYVLEIVTFNDYVLPNLALEQGELDANYFQHKPYLDNFNEENNTHLVTVGAVHFEPLGIYAGKTGSLNQLQSGAAVAVPNDTTNEARALLLLERQGLIKLNPDAGLTATVQDITENPLNLDITELEAAQVARALQDVDIAVINGNYAIEAGLSTEDTLALEDAQSQAAQTYANFVVVKEGNEKNEAVQALLDAVLSDSVRNYINETYKGAVVPVF